MPSPTRRNIIHLSDNYYRFGDRDPDLVWACNEIRAQGLSVGEVIDNVLDLSNGRVSISYRTIDNWLTGHTRHPRNHTLAWVALALGYKHHWRKIT